MPRLFISLTVFVVAILFTDARAQLFENFENGTKGGYADGTVNLDSGIWFFKDALIGNIDSDKKNGSRSARIRDGYIEMQFNKANGAGEVSFYYARFGSDAATPVRAWISDNGGSSWSQIGTDLTPGTTLQQAVIQVNVPGDVRLRIGKALANTVRINIDDVRITDYVAASQDPTLNLTVNGSPYGTGELFDFGIVAPGSIGTAGFRIRNTGEEPLIISSALLEGAGFSTDADFEDLEIGLFENFDFDVVFSPTAEDIYSGSLTLATNDPDNQEFVLQLAGSTPATAEPVTIAEARALPLGTVVTVGGWVTVTDQFRGPVYLQDETAGIGWFNNADMRVNWNIDARIGDSLVVTGSIGQFNNLLQIVDDIVYTVYPESNREIEPREITIADLNTGNYEGQLVVIRDVAFTASGTFSGGTNYAITDASGSGEMRVDAFTNIAGTNIPNEPVDLTGVAGRFQNFRQLLPRFTADIQFISGGPVIASAAPYEVFATPGSITFSWETEQPGHSEVRFGLSPGFELGRVIDEEHKTTHRITIADLEPATTYMVQLRSAAGTDTSATSAYLASSASPSGTTGTIDVYFNQSVDNTLATWQEATGNENFANRLIGYIEQASETAEFAFYSISGTVGNQIAGKIIEAHQRGVAVRVIASGHTGNPNAVINMLSNAGVHATLSTGMEQHHNKFAIFDANHADPARSRVVTSSWNATDDGTFNQYQNMVVIQDVALARAYLLEFNQMWGGASGNFNPAAARFSDNKAVVNPSVFWIGGDSTRVKLYFSPQANTESQINRALSTAKANIDLGLNLITRRTISNTMLSRFNDGVKVRGVIGAIAVQGSEFEYLSGWADVHHFSQAEFGLLHHKYAIIDGENTNSNSAVITGSHNWSANANLRNDENTLIIRNGRIANEFLQEFAVRYVQAGGQDIFTVVSLEEEHADLPQDLHLYPNYPNPFNPATNIRFSLGSSHLVTVDVFDITGRKVATLAQNQSYSAGTHQLTFDASGLSSGVYMYQLRLNDGRSMTGKMMLVK